MDCLLHIGTEKTATTLLQSWLYSNRNALSAEGVFLSSVLKEGNNRKLVSFFQTQVDDWLKRQKINTTEEKAAFFDGFDADFRREVEEAATTHHTMIITSEHFHSRLRHREQLEALKKLLDELFERVRVVCYFRDQADYAVSTYSTKLRNAYPHSLETFLGSISPEGYYFNHEDSAALWASVFGEHACQFAVFDRAAFVDHDIRRDFIAHLSTPVNSKSLNYAVERRNESLSRFQARLFQVINQRIPFWKPGRVGLNRLNRKLKTTVENIAGIDSGSLEAAKQGLRDEFADSNRRFLARWAPNRTDLLDHGAGKPSDARTGADSVAQVTAQTTMDMAEVEALLANLLDGLLDKHLSHGRALLDEDAQELVAFYDRYRKTCPEDIEGAQFLLALAQRARPGGQVIKDRLAALEKTEGDAAETPEG
jgi:hypothetical protein